MSFGLSDEQRQEVQRQPGKPIEIRDEKTQKIYFIVEGASIDSAVDAMRREADYIATQQGIADMKAGRVTPLEEVDAEIRQKRNWPPRQKQ